MSWRRLAVLASNCLLCSLLSACGSDTSAPTASVPTAAPEETPGASPSPSLDYTGSLHVLQGHSVSTYAIDATTGKLRLASTLKVGEAHALTGEPRGRFVFASFGPRDGSEPDPSIVAYAPDGRGNLAAVSEVSSRPICDCGSAVRGGWLWLSAGSDRVYAVWETRAGGAYHRQIDTYVTHSVAGDGALGPAYDTQFTSPYDSGGGAVTVDLDSNILYKSAPDGGRGGVIAHTIDPNGHLLQMGWSNICGARQIAGPARFPLVAARVFLFAAAYTDSGLTGSPRVCAWKGARLAPVTSLELDAGTAAAHVPSSESQPMLLAFAGTPPRPARAYRYEVRISSMSLDGELHLLDATGAPSDGDVMQLLFHPSGRFLYASYAIGGTDGTHRSYVAANLRTFAVGTDGRLEMIQDLEGAGGYVTGWWYPNPPLSTMAITTPRSAVDGSEQ